MRAESSVLSGAAADKKSLSDLEIISSVVIAELRLSPGMGKNKTRKGQWALPAQTAAACARIGAKERLSDLCQVAVVGYDQQVEDKTAIID